jgi:hypothetical protein
LVVLCAGSTLLLVKSYTLTNIYLAPLSGVSQSYRALTFGSVVLSPNGSINLGFTTEGNLLLCSLYLPLGVPNWVPTTHHQCTQQELKRVIAKVDVALSKASLAVDVERFLLGEIENLGKAMKCKFFHALDVLFF